MNTVYRACDRKPTVRQYGVRIKNTKRFVIFLVCTLLLITTAFALAFNNTYAAEITEAEEYVVNYGDSLWSIAQENKPANTDTRDYISMIREFNGLDDGFIIPGQILLLP